MKRIALIFCLTFVTQFAFSQLKVAQINPAKVPELNQHYLPEYTFDVSTNPELWSKQKPGLECFFCIHRCVVYENGSTTANRKEHMGIHGMERRATECTGFGLVSGYTGTGAIQRI